MCSSLSPFMRSKGRDNLRGLSEREACRCGTFQRGWSSALTEQADVDLLQRVHAAELVELVVDLVEYQGLVVVGREVPHNVVHWMGGQGHTHTDVFPGVAATYYCLWSAECCG